MSEPATPDKPEVAPSSGDKQPPLTVDRRSLLIGGGVALAGVLGYSLFHRMTSMRAEVFVASGQKYDGPLVKTIREGLLAVGIQPEQIAGKRVLLKPNLVEPNRKVPQMTTNPAMIVAAAAVFRGWGASVVVGEAPGHVRDTEMAVVESGLQGALDDEKLEFADLNYEESKWLPNKGRSSKLEGFYFPRSIVEADLVVSMPKLKTHHWVGFTASMKNLYGTLPGLRYGWPKNVLHHAGIPQTVYDINASLPKTLAIVDGIVGMEGDGPIMGSPKRLGLVLIGTNLTAVDATVARIMGLVPDRISYLSLAADRLGPIDDRRIEQRGEAWRPLVNPLKIINVPELKSLQNEPGELFSSLRRVPPANSAVRIIV